MHADFRTLAPISALGWHSGCHETQWIFLDSESLFHQNSATIRLRSSQKYLGSGKLPIVYNGIDYATTLTRSSRPATFSSFPFQVCSCFQSHSLIWLKQTPFFCPTTVGRLRYLLCWSTLATSNAWTRASC